MFRFASQLAFFFVLFCFASFSQGTGRVIIKGYAPNFIGKEVKALIVQDYMSELEEQIDFATVKEDSTFRLSFPLEETQKLILRIQNNVGFLYAEPGREYELFFSEKDPFSPKLKSGNKVELAFRGLSEDDINYKILSYNRWEDEYMSSFYHLKDYDPILFAQKLDTFKIYVERAYVNDSSIFFQTFVRFRIAALDEIVFAGSRNKYEKYDFYIRPTPVFYKNDAYMAYIKRYYKNLIPRLSKETNNAVYLGVLKASPTAVMKAYGTEYSTQNLRLREMVMIQSLCEQFYTDDFPQTNILTILDSLSNRALFKEHRAMASNMKARLLEMVPGAKMPHYILHTGGDSIVSDMSLRGKHIYFHFYDPSSLNCQKELPLLDSLHAKYGTTTQFITIYLQTEKDTIGPKNWKWPVYSTNHNPDLIKLFKVRNYPEYFLIDAQGYVVAAPALGPSTLRQDDTIEKTLYYIRRVSKEINKD